MPGDLESLVRALAAAGISDPDLDDLKAAVTEDEADPETPAGAPGRRVREWLGRLALGAGAFAMASGADAVGGVAAELIKNYYQIH
jgi:hypothetical protein